MKIKNYTLCDPMEFPIKFDTIKAGWPIAYIEESPVIISNKHCISLKIYFGLANSADPDEIRHYEAVHLHLRCLQAYLFRGFWYTKG